VRALDNVIDINFYPTEAARTANPPPPDRARGDGPAERLYKKGIPFASDEAVEFNDEFMEAIAYYAYEASSDLAAERGTYHLQGLQMGPRAPPAGHPRAAREGTRRRVDVPRGGKWTGSPCATRSPAGHAQPTSSPSPPPPPSRTSWAPVPASSRLQEPLREEQPLRRLHRPQRPPRQATSRRAALDPGDARQPEVLRRRPQPDREGIPEDIKRKYQTAFDIDYRWVIDAAARRQKWIDQSQSVNLFLARPDIKTLSHMYRAAWHQGLKTTYYLRTLGASNIEKATVAPAAEGIRD
jgi:ribonucleoside-diphosphate reductase alpha chain